MAIRMTPQMIDAGILALRRSQAHGHTEEALVQAVYNAMCGQAFEQFATETLLNIRGIAEDIALCERRVIEHLAEIGLRD